MDDAKLRAWWAHRQSLDGGLEKATPAAILEKCGWARSVGGSGPYLTLFSRAGVSREAADRAVAALEIHELPSARGCTYVLPAADFALGLKVGEAFAGADMNVARKLGVTDKEIDRLCDAVRKALDKGPLEPEQIRESTGGAARHLGEAGKKKGMITTLPVALGRLQVSGDIRRIPLNGRLDNQRYRYTLWKPGPLAKWRLSADETYIELARRYFTWIGPATLAEFQWFSGLGVKAAKAAVEPLELAAIADGDPRLLAPADRDDLLSFKTPKEPRYALVSGIDSILLLRRNIVTLLDRSDLNRRIPGEGGTVESGTIADLPSNAILDRGRVVGLWEYDTATSAIAWMSFVKPNKALEQAVARTEEFVRTQLGDARSFSLDSPKSRAPRVEALRQAARLQ